MSRHGKDHRCPPTPSRRPPGSLDEGARRPGRPLARRELPLRRPDLSDGQPLLTEPLRPEHVKPRLLGHWGTSPGLNLVHPSQPGDQGPGPRRPVYLGPRPRRNRSPGQLVAGGLVHRDLPGHHQGRERNGPAVQAVLVPRRRAERTLSHPRRAGSIHEGGRARFRRSRTPTAPPSTTPAWWCACIDRRRRRAETDPLATSWHSNGSLDPVSDGAVLP
ncbi:hypothetical protein LV779_08700 [Streptomyces thinghirensis]|nr:hypothetical protein [Streptomyces thinghirensis]